MIWVPVIIILSVLLSVCFAFLTVMVIGWFGPELALWQGWVINVLVSALVGSRASS